MTTAAEKKGQAGEPIRGVVKWFDDSKGFGFITPSDGTGDIFVHHSSVITDGYQTLQKGQEVEFLKVRGPRGPVAQNVRPLTPAI
ncbi:MAG: cold shock domain-containing protein [Pseudomonadota bacterium]